MKQLLTYNLVWKLLSVALAFILWIAVAQEPELATSISVPILFKNLPDDLDIATDVPERVHLEVRGMARRLTPESLSQTAVILDLFRLQPGEQTFTIQDYNIRQLPIGVVFYRAVPSQVAMRFDHLLTRNVPLEPTYGQGPPDGYMVLKYEFEPPTVRIRGPEGRVQGIDHVTTDAIDLSGIVSRQEKRVRVRVGDPRVRLVSGPEVKFRVELGKINKEN